MHVIRTPCVKDRLQGKPADPAAEKSTIEPAFPRAFYAQNLCNYTASNIWHVQEKKKIEQCPRNLRTYRLRRHAIFHIEVLGMSGKGGRERKEKRGTERSRATSKRLLGVV